MKAEAPEKIYLEWYREGDKIYRDWCITPKTNNEPVEYTCTDIFIDKAEKYLKDQFIKDVSVLATGVISINFSTAIKNFVNYMKGE